MILIKSENCEKKKHRLNLSKTFYGKVYLRDLFTARVDKLKELQHFTVF